MVKALIFDCFGVLTTDVWRAFLDSLPPSADLERARDLNHAVDAGMITMAEFIDGVEEAVGVRPPDLEQVMGGEVVKNEPLLAYIAELKQQGYVIGLLSNISNNWIRKEFLTAEEQDLFDAMVMSYEVGMTKPDPRMFMLMCERLRVSAHEAVMIDDVESYAAAAIQEGLYGITYTDLDTLKQQLNLLLNSNDQPLGASAQLP